MSPTASPTGNAVCYNGFSGQTRPDTNEGNRMTSILLIAQVLAEHLRRRWTVAFAIVILVLAVAACMLIASRPGGTA